MHYLNLFLSIFFSAFALRISNPIGNKSPMEVPGLFEGDIAGVNPHDKGLLSTAYARWTSGIVPYIIDNSYSSTQLQAIYDGMRLIEDQTRINGRNCITFTPRTTQANYIRIMSSSGCFSYIGMQGSQQTVSLQAGSCTYIGLVAHELTHALGFWHEQSRADRDNYVTINYQNIQANQAYNFDKYTTNVDYQGFSYDYYSIMHYHNTEFSSNGQPTIVAKTPGVTLIPAWQKYSLTATDVGEIRKRYGCV